MQFLLGKKDKKKDKSMTKEQEKINKQLEKEKKKFSKGGKSDTIKNSTQDSECNYLL